MPRRNILYLRYAKCYIPALPLLLAILVGAQMLRPDWKRVMFFTAVILFLIEAGEFAGFGVASKASTVLGALISIVFIAYTATYLLSRGRPRVYSNLERCFPWLFLSILALFLAQLLFAVLYLHANHYFPIYNLFDALALVPIYLPVILFALFAASLWRSKVGKKHAMGVKAFALILFAIMVVIVALFFLSGYFTTHFYVSDEEFISLNAALTFMSGHNPYTAHYAGMLYNYSTGPSKPTDYTYTTNNTFQSGVDYPALYFLASVPALLLVHASPYGPNYSSMVLAELFVFVTLLVLVVAFVLDKGSIRRPPVAAIFFLILFFSLFSTYIEPLMLALVLIAFYKIDSKYLWIVLGLAASLQEELWVVVLLFLLYSFRNQGLKRGALNTIGTIAVFLLINGYFIAASPHAYISQVFAPVSGYNLPSSAAMLGFPVLSLYGVPLSSSNVLFLSSIAILAILFVYLNEKRLIFLFSLIPLMFLFRAIIPYYFFFMPAMVLALYITARERRAAKTGAKPSNRNIVIGAVVAISLVSAALLAVSHNQFAGVGVMVSNPSLVSGQIANYTLYNATLDYGPTSMNQLSVIEYVTYYTGGGPSLYGLSQGNMLISPTPRPVNSSTQYLVNPNRVYLNASGGSIHLSLLIPTMLTRVNATSVQGGNSSKIQRVSVRVYAAQCVLYNGAYYYTCPNAYAK